MDYLGGNFSSRKRKVAGVNGAVEGELVTSTPTNYTQPKALPNETFIDGQKASTAVGRPNPQIQQALTRPNALSGDLVTQPPAAFNPTPAAQNPVINGQVSRPTLGVQPTVSAANPVNTGATATQSLTQIAQKPALPPYQAAVNPANQYGGMPPNNPPVANAASVGATPPAQSITTRLANGVSKLASATPALQAGMNAQNIHAGSIADPNFGNELMGDKQKFSRTQTLAAKPTTGSEAVGRGGIPVVPEQFINSRAGKIANPAYAQYAANHPQKPAVAPVQFVGNEQASISHTPPNYSLSNPRKQQSTYAEQPLNGESPVQQNSKQPRMPTSMNDVTSGTGYIKGGDGAFKNGMGFVQNSNGMMGSDGRQRKPSDAPSMDKLGKRLDIDVLDRLSAQRESGAITAAQASQIYDQYKQDTAPLAQQPQMAMQRMAAQGNIPAAQQLTQEAQQQALGRYQQGTLDASNKKQEHDWNSPTAKYEDATKASQLESFSRMRPEQQAAFLNPPKYEKMSRSIDDGVNGKRTEDVLYNTKDPNDQIAPIGLPPAKTDAKAPKKGESLNGLTPEQESSFPVGHELVGGDGKVAYKKNEDGTYLNLKTGKNEHPF